MRIRWSLFAFSISAALLLSSCGTESSGTSQQLNYKDMKSMVIDILKTEDAQKALQESSQQMSGLSTQESKLLSVQDQEEVRLVVKDVISSPDYDKVIKSLMTDTRFAGEFAKAVNKDNKTIHKELMKDPQYQTELVKTLKTPEMEKLILEVLQSTKYRQEVMTLMQESMQNPLFRLEILDLMKAAVKEHLEPKPDEKSKGKEEEKKGEEEQKQGQEEEQKGEGGQ